MNIIIRETKNKPRTFYLQVVSDYTTVEWWEYNEAKRVIVDRLMEEVCQKGLKPNLRVTNNYNPSYYITFRSKYDVTAFRLGWDVNEYFESEWE